MPGLLHAAAAEHALDLEGSWMIGGALDDVEAGRRAGCRTVLLGSHAADLAPLRRPHAVATDLLDAAEAILRAEPTAAAIAPRGTPARLSLAR
jgi:histidinol phosphatase-like enzyme